MFKRYLLTFFLVFFIACGIASAEDMRLEASFERGQVSPGNPIYLNLTFFGAQDVQPPIVSGVDGITIRYVGPATRITVVNGRVSKSVTHSYLVMPLREGTFEIGPFSVKYNGTVYNAPAVKLNVGGGGAVSRVPVGMSSAAVQQQQSGPSGSSGPVFGGASSGAGKSAPYKGDKVFLVMSVPKNQIYVNETVPLVLKLYVDDVGLRDIEYPLLESKGFSTAEWSEPQKTEESYRGQMYGVLVFKRDISGIKEGEYTLGPAKLGCKMVVRKDPQRQSSFFKRSAFDNDDFFSDIFRRYETYPIDLESNPVAMTVLAFPEEGKPADYQGAVGDYRMEVKVDPVKVKVGDPVTVRMTISGEGNMDTITAPKMEIGEDFKSYEPQVTKKGTTKIYEQILIPKTTKVKEIPGVSFSFFNPRKGKYETITKPPVKIEVQEQPESEKAVKIVSMEGKEEMLYPPEKLGEDIIHIKEDIGRLREKGELVYTKPYFWGLQGSALALFLFFYVFHKRKEKLRTDRKYARFLKAPGSAKQGIKEAGAYLRKNDLVRFYDTVFRTMQKYLGNKFDMPEGGITAQDIDNKLRTMGCEEGVIGMVDEIFSGCDTARYAPSTQTKEDAEAVLEKVRKAIDYFERNKF